MAETDSSDDEVYEDALENDIVKEESHNSLPLTPDEDLENLLKETTVFIDLFLSNNFSKALEEISKGAKTSIYHALGRGVFMFIRAFMTFETGDIRVAMDTIKEAVAVCQRYRKKFSALYRVLGWSGDSSYTD
ncbi:tetratricopeptide repeat protein 39B-like, partial [Limulus polyphemus]|uniref:Tetratricopeptide repeat protein 39B-like n=1 Tax=Limulus polyphemus TaxID=6850 RepID=A0ABM1TEH4_LIMPO